MLVLAFSQMSLADCVRGTIHTIPGVGAAGLYVRGNLMGAIPNPRGLKEGQTGYFEFKYLRTPDEPQVAPIEVKKVHSCHQVQER